MSLTTNQEALLATHNVELEKAIHHRYWDAFQGEQVYEVQNKKKFEILCTQGPSQRYLQVEKLLEQGRNVPQKAHATKAD